MSDTTTQGVRVQVNSYYVEERSSPTNNLYFFAYKVVITNQGDETVQLINREWVITDFNGKVERVQGPGVVGEQPVLQPGESFDYTSFCPLTTPFGSMEGHYEMILDNGSTFKARIAPFSLSPPYAVN
ncbi:MAG TPA: Co2+/Mg2+ efflux protein ApaG [Acidobacteriota bacterium]|nr:Co2+/Mg2+ efflux protein ApaG [Acidobacteriota bacterium]